MRGLPRPSTVCRGDARGCRLPSGACHCCARVWRSAQRRDRACEPPAGGAGPAALHLSLWAGRPGAASPSVRLCGLLSEWSDGGSGDSATSGLFAGASELAVPCDACGSARGPPPCLLPPASAPLPFPSPVLPSFWWPRWPRWPRTRRVRTRVTAGILWAAS